MKAGRRRTGSRTAAVLLAAVALTAHPSAGAAQSDRTGEDQATEIRLLRQATSMEVRGRYDEAREVLEELLRLNPASSAAVFSLERVLRPIGRVREVLPWADRFLDVEPRAAGVRYLVLRVLTEVDSTAALRPAVDAWIEADPGATEAYLEGARVLEEVHGPGPALEILERGREALADPAVFALERGDLLLRTGAPDRAAEAWSAAVGPDGEGAARVMRQVERADVDATAAVLRLVELLDTEPTTPERRMAAVTVALEAGQVDAAADRAASVARSLDGQALRAFLTRTAAAAEEADAPALTLWAWERLAESTVGERERRALDARIAATALAAGDTATAVAAQARLAGGLEPGSAERRRVIADLIRVEADFADAETLRRRLDGFRAEFPDAPELDALASAVAAGLRARGRGAEAAEVLEGVRGPRSSLERAWLLFESDSLAAGTEALLASTGGLEPASATEVIQLAALLERLQPASAAVAARAAALAHRGDATAALTALEAGLDGAPSADRAPLLAHAARVADGAGRAATAATFRARLLEEHPDAPEAAEATLALARWHAAGGDGVAEAVTLLEELILSRPGSAVVPVARRELERLRGGVEGGSP